MGFIFLTLDWRYEYERKGYECIAINYGDFSNIDDATANAETQINKINLSNYDDIVFFSKNMGTVIADRIEDGLCNENIRQI